MKKLTSILAALLCCGLICSAADAPKPAPQKKDAAAATKVKKLKKRQPRAIGSGKVPVFAYNGGRPWVGHDCMAPIVTAGGKLFLFDSVYLAGLGGASIKQHMGDKVEPPARDGFTQSFQKLAEQGPAAARVVVFNYIPIKNMEKIFDEREDAMPAMRAYLEKGGNLLFYGNVPSESKVASLMPVEFEGDGYTSYGEEAHTTRPSGARFSMFPEKMPAFGGYRPCDTVKGAEVLSWIIEDRAKMSPFIARRKIGKGTVTFINLNLYNPTSPDSYGHWEYARAFTAALVADCGNIDEINPAKCIKSLEAIPNRKQVAETKAVVGDPALDIVESASVKVSGDTATFENGCRVVLDRKSGKVDVYVPGVEGKFLSDCATPEVRLSKKQATIDKNSNEYTGVTDFDVSAKIPWKVADFSVDGNQAVVTFKASGNEMRWYFKAGSWNLDGRTYVGVADRAEVTKSPLLISGFRFQRSVAVPDPLFARRMSCYTSPRGYADFDLRGKKNAMAGMKKPEKDKISAWSMIGSGQPFELVVFKGGVYLTTLTAPYSVNTGMEVGEPGTPITVTNSFGVGRVKAPVSSQYYWRWFSKGPERGHNEYLAAYQATRRFLRAWAGLEDRPAYPTTWYPWINDRTATENIQDAIASYGFRYVKPPMYESPIESLGSERCIDLCKTLKSKGLAVHAWSAGSYTQGENNWIVKNHPEWMCRNETGKIHTYPGNYCVIDVGNPEFLKWYKGLLKPAIDAGLGWIYRDMDAAATGQINYSLPETRAPIESMIKFYRFFHDNNVLVGIEGQNPLVIDEYWIRANKYLSFAGREFAMVGEAPYCDVRAGYNLDAFRTGMYACFPAVEISGLALNHERISGELERGKRVVSFVPKFNEALDHCGMPFVRETDFGTTWTGPKGAALFFWNPAKKVTVDLPAGWKIRGVEGNVLTDVKGDSIYLIDRN